MHALVVSYEMAMAEITELRRLEWGVMVVDEGHRLKNPNSRLFRARTRHHLCCIRKTAHALGLFADMHSWEVTP